MTTEADTGWWLDDACERARAALLAERTEAGPWRGELSSSALSTATAVMALGLAARAGRPEFAALAQRGRAWLAATQRPPGGFGDTVESPPNPSTTALAWAALGPGLGLESLGPERDARREAEAWLAREIGAPVEPATLARVLEDIYGEDRTFAVPILTACALAGAYGEGADAWRHVRALPFELAVLPQSLFRFVGLPVVSYALPALIAIGQAIAHHRPSGNPFARGTRAATRARTLRVLERIQPENGGFLEATPLTSFVAMSLVSIGLVDHPVTRRCFEFLVASMRDDGSWPIDTDLATWVTTLSIGALGPEALDAPTLEWLLAQQHKVRHPYTGAAPGGWAWTERPGGVPDADDTPGALLALASSGDRSPRVVEAASIGIAWLCDLQNRDGGIPTFCRGWGKLPFDQSCADLTAHALRAFAAWREHVDAALARRIDPASQRGQDFLVRTQAPDGSWVPLWFGNQHHPGKLNPTYGTSRVLRAATVSGDDSWREALALGLMWLRSAQGDDGGYGGAPGLASSIEETGLALEALVDAREAGFGDEHDDERIERAARWIDGATMEGQFPAKPIGLYFAQLWYHERLYPRIFAASGLRSARRVLGTETRNETPAGSQQGT